MGWFEYLFSSHAIYPRLVKLFYANLESSTTCIAKSFVLGTPISITPNLIAETLGIPNEGITNFNDIGITEALGICLEQPNVNPLMNVTSSHLPIASRIILLLVTNTFLPKEGSHTLPSERDLKFVACVKNGTPINLPYLIASHVFSSVFWNFKLCIVLLRLAFELCKRQCGLCTSNFKHLMLKCFDP
ncbi:hypothetical protein CFOL_v3_05154 [Cephalotus follicularis]|uniref:Putative plant transposon protein domain-containing protein n=1 Tax=Cephalotus follicularis TaxID=3775 RepID=A0A1Q3B0U8_CEPFO|nr:hypothetical protein CFOL_v3_05154 [Cephalotus follicularis]